VQAYLRNHSLNLTEYLSACCLVAVIQRYVDSVLCATRCIKNIRIFIPILEALVIITCARRTYLRDLVEATHLFMKMLERHCSKHSHLVVQRKKKKVRKRAHPKKKDNQSGNIPVVCHSFIRGGGWPLAVFRRAFQPTASAEA